jgi:succinate dehydrogenase / fumarate reductase iron-sulfur subunit
MPIEVSTRVFRFRAGAEPRFERYAVTVPDEANVIDVIDAVWRQDSTLMYRHACHHASCGTCAVRINGYERLPCIVSVKSALAGQAELVIEPLRNFPLVGDLVVDFGLFFEKQAASTMAITRAAEPKLGDQPYQRAEVYDEQGQLESRPYTRFENCVECGICLSACPTMAATDQFYGPAGLAAVYRAVEKASDPARRSALLDLVDTDQAVWQCHSAWECTEACPQDVRPAEAIMGLRRLLAGRKLRALFGRGERE